MKNSLAPAPNLEHLKKQAKDLLKSHRNRNTDCCRILQNLSQFKKRSVEEIFQTELKLATAQLALALDYGFKNWGELKRHVLKRHENLKYLHIHCGDGSAQPLRNSSVPGDVLVWREIYIEGPVPGNVSQEEFIRIRAEFIHQAMKMDLNGIIQGSEARYQMLSEAGKYGEVILWFDSCMFDQTILIHLLDLCSEQNWTDNTKLSLICIDRGLGELSMDELEALMNIRQEVTAEQKTLAHHAWQAFRAENPQDIKAILQQDCSSLPFLKDALIRHLEQYPSIKNGLNRTENQILQCIDSGTHTLQDIFIQVSSMEKRPFLGDTSLWEYIDHLADGKEPLLHLEGPGKLKENMTPDPIMYTIPALKDIKRWQVSLTKTGKELLEGRKNQIKINGIDRWLGGVHLQGYESPWHWDQDNADIISNNVTGENTI